MKSILGGICGGLVVLMGCAADSSAPADAENDGAGSSPTDSTSPTTPSNPGSSGSSGSPGSPASPVTPTSPPTSSPGSVTLKILTYNVAGLPQGLSSSSPAQNTSQISPMLNPYDFVAVQEDFSYHSQLISLATHAFKTPPMAAPSAADLGDGLNALSRYAFTGLTRTKWSKCNGYIDQKNDCLTSKGFASFEMDLGSGMLVDVYDAHFDAGRSDDDAKARDKQAAQLVDAINAKSGANGHAVIVLGDTNMKTTDESTLQLLLTGAKLTCACRSIMCAEPDRIDRVMFRSSSPSPSPSSSSGVAVQSKSWHVETTFVDAQGKPLSDHEPVSVELSISKL